MPFISNTPEQQKEMLESIGLTMEQLFVDIPEKLRCKPLNMPAALTEQEVRKHLAELAGKNSIDLTCFLGGGFYDHFIPAALYAIISRSEFYTAYTPYQPEISQGTLQAIYEFQSAICRLTEMEASNTSLYIPIDGPSRTVKPGAIYQILGNHLLICEDVYSGWPNWVLHLNQGSVFLPYPGPYVLFTKAAKTESFVMVQPDTLVMGWILDICSQVYGDSTIGKIS